tara:strand:- start:59 stop:304 length:246 start_codon:yes stop_codon:yes gene_type:complete
MGKMKELYIAIQEGYMQDLRDAYMKAYSENRETIMWQGQEVSMAYAKYLLDFEDTFLKGLTDDNIRNANDEFERFISPRED